MNCPLRGVLMRTPAPGTATRTALCYTARPNVEGLTQLRARSRFRSEPQPLDARHQAALRSEPAEGPDLRRRRPASRVRLHALPQGRQGHQGRLARRVVGRLSADGPATVADVSDPSLVRFRVAVQGALA